MAIFIIKDRKATQEELDKMSYELGDYVKVVVDVEKGVLAGGGGMHYDEEQLLLEYGCEQKNLWGGGVDFTTKEIDYNSMINVRPNQDNPSRDILSQDIRKKFKKIVEEILL
ncbi:MAG: DUF5674 family protein [Patescibacteria group bacterium]